jgi:cytochrome c-type biogenesis protein CcmH
MWMFWILAGLMAAGACAMVTAAAGRAATRAAGHGEDPALPVYRRHLAELDEQAAQGLLGPDELATARAEAGRRLLKSADTLRRTELPGGKRSRMAVAVGGAAAAILALGVYLVLGSPGLPDQPFKARVAGWRRADPATLDPARMAAVLREIVAARPNDPQAFEYLGRAELASGDGFAAARAFATAARLAPGRADLFTEEGMALTADNEGKVSPEARAAFRQALAIDPRNAPARYFLGRAKIADGDVAGGLDDWRALEAELPPNDPRRADLEAEIAARGKPVTAAAAAEAPPPMQASAAGAGPSRPLVADPSQMAFIQAMVARQAAALRAHPDDAQGWVRLVRSYGVLGEREAQAAALEEARRHLAGHPDALAQVEAEAKPR